MVALCVVMANGHILHIVYSKFLKLQCYVGKRSPSPLFLSKKKKIKAPLSMSTLVFMEFKFVKGWYQCPSEIDTICNEGLSNQVRISFSIQSVCGKCDSFSLRFTIEVWLHEMHSAFSGKDVYTMTTHLIFTESSGHTGTVSFLK